MKHNATVLSSVQNPKVESNNTVPLLLELEPHAMAWLEYEMEFPIADERHQNRFEQFLSLIDTTEKNKGGSDREYLVSVITPFYSQLENYIEKLNVYRVEPASTELQLESHPISYSIKVFTENLETLQKIRTSIDSHFTSGKSIIKTAKNAEGKEFDPG